MSKTIELKDSQTITLERKIAAALDASDITSADLLSLIDETTAAIDAADVAAKSERARALDPIASPDAAKAREAMQASEFAAARLRTTLPRLEIKQQEAAAEEFLQRWLQDFAEHKVERDALAKEGKEFLPEAIAKIADYFDRCAKLDAKLSKLHQARPSGVAMHLIGAELTARHMEAFTRDNPSLAAELKLPDFDNAARMLWPPPAPSLSSLVGLPVQRHLGGDWWQDHDQRAAEQDAERTRVTTYYEDQQRIREEREATP